MHATKQSNLYEVIGRVKNRGEKYYRMSCQICGAPTVGMAAEQPICWLCEKNLSEFASKRDYEKVEELCHLADLYESAYVGDAKEYYKNLILTGVSQFDPRTPSQIEMDDLAADWKDTQAEIVNGTSSAEWWASVKPIKF